MFDLENESRAHGVQHSRWSHSMANINLYRSHTWAFFSSFHLFRDILISKFVTLKMLVKVMMYNIYSSVIQWQIPDFWPDSNSNVCSISHRLQDFRNSNKLSKVWPGKWRSRSMSIRRKTGVAPFDWKCLILYKWIFFQKFSYSATYVCTKRIQTKTQSHVWRL